MQEPAKLHFILPFLTLFGYRTLFFHISNNSSPREEESVEHTWRNAVLDPDPDRSLVLSLNLSPP